MGKAIAPFGLRIPPELNQWIEERAKENGRSKNAEIVARLKESCEGEQTWKTAVIERLTTIESSIEQLKDAIFQLQSGR